MDPVNAPATETILGYMIMTRAIIKFPGSALQVFYQSPFNQTFLIIFDLQAVKVSTVEIYFKCNPLFLFYQVPLIKMALKSVNSPPPVSITHSSPNGGRPFSRGATNQGRYTFLLWTYC